ncbi:hypothetical protein KCU93_g253, partial [Aureobasidium melanogenum]
MFVSSPDCRASGARQKVRVAVQHCQGSETWSSLSTPLSSSETATESWSNSIKPEACAGTRWHLGFAWAKKRWFHLAKMLSNLKLLNSKPLRPAARGSRLSQVLYCSPC